MSAERALWLLRDAVYKAPEQQSKLMLLDTINKAIKELDPLPSAGWQPVRSQRCCGCPSFPAVMCPACHRENYGGV